MATAQTILQPLEEFRFEVVAGAEMTVKLKDGAAEIFGSEMAMHREYRFSGTQQAVFTWHGCILEVGGQSGHSYVASDNPMDSYMQLHAELEARREAYTEPLPRTTTLVALRHATHLPQALMLLPAHLQHASKPHLPASRCLRHFHHVSSNRPRVRVAWTVLTF